MKNNFSEWIFVVICLILSFMVSSCKAEWFVGHDNGEAYMRYQDEMRKYIDENGLFPDIYGYGWANE